ncbi:glycosyltransferase [Butyrivibrio sp. VCD2006]|uniref:glycosyltransferase n=1 Tax=Butyrivibrio sp. VCD2006 TaxID=1280664 RepID=UPI000420099A|nr:glycosyltransferase [Butyrivibrio sp. VCD2006]
METHIRQKEHESAESYILRAGAFEQEGSSVDEYAVLIEGLRAHYDNYELYFMLGLYYRYRNADQAFLCFENAIRYCEEPEDEKIIRDAMDGLRDRARVRGTSIVIVSYNDLELCRECIRSIRRYTSEDRTEIIVVDNASTDEELLRFLREQNEKSKGFKLIENKKNEGFPAGCNEGLDAANPDNDVFFLNNDAILMPNALFWLKMGLYADKRNGAAGAVTNCAPSQEVSMESLSPYMQKAPMDEARPLFSINDGTKEKRWWRTISLDSALETAKSYAKDHNVPMWNPYEVRCRLTGFAVLMRREAVNDVIMMGREAGFEGNKANLFDERFSPGYFEDDDLGIRLCLGGWRQILCHNAFIYHHGGDGFAEKNDAMEVSRGKFKEKWGFDIWNYILFEDEKMTALMNAISEGDKRTKLIAGKGKGESEGLIGESSSEVDNPAGRLKLYNRVLRILDICAGMGTTLSAIKYQMPDSFTAGITNVDVFAGLSKYMADDMISGDPELVTFPWPEHSFDYIIVGDAATSAADPEGLLRKLKTYLKDDGQIVNVI